MKIKTNTLNTNSMTNTQIYVPEVKINGHWYYFPFVSTEEDTSFLMKQVRDIYPYDENGNEYKEDFNNSSLDKLGIETIKYIVEQINYIKPETSPLNKSSVPFYFIPVIKTNDSKGSFTDSFETDEVFRPINIFYTKDKNCTFNGFPDEDGIPTFGQIKCRLSDTEKEEYYKLVENDLIIIDNPDQQRIYLVKDNRAGFKLFSLELLFPDKYSNKENPLYTRC